MGRKAWARGARVLLARTGVGELEDDVVRAREARMAGANSSGLPVARTERAGERGRRERRGKERQGRRGPATGGRRRREGPRLTTAGLLLALGERLDVGMWLEATLDAWAWGSSRGARWGWIDGWIGKAGEYPDWSDGENEVDLAVGGGTGLMGQAP